MANPPFGDSSKDPKLPTYSTGSWNFNGDNLDDSASNPTGSTLAKMQIRGLGVGTSNADWNNGTFANTVPKAFPGLQS